MSTLFGKCNCFPPAAPPASLTFSIKRILGSKTRMGYIPLNADGITDTGRRWHTLRFDIRYSWGGSPGYQLWKVDKWSGVAALIEDVTVQRPGSLGFFAQFGGITTNLSPTTATNTTNVQNNDTGALGTQIIDWTLQDEYTDDELAADTAALLAIVTYADSLFVPTDFREIVVAYDIAGAMHYALSTAANGSDIDPQYQYPLALVAGSQPPFFGFRNQAPFTTGGLNILIPSDVIPSANDFAFGSSPMRYGPGPTLYSARTQFTFSGNYTRRIIHVDGAGVPPGHVDQPGLRASGVAVEETPPPDRGCTEVIPQYFWASLVPINPPL